jgi:hypothetical protein
MEAVKGYLIYPFPVKSLNLPAYRPKELQEQCISTIALAINEGLTKKLPHLPDGRIIW